MGTVQKILSKEETSSARDTINYTQQQWQREEKKKKDFSREEESELHIRADRLIIRFSWVSYYKRKI